MIFILKNPMDGITCVPKELRKYNVKTIVFINIAKVIFTIK
jgi:hypothetical protein